MHEKNNTETYITICKIDSQREIAVEKRKLNQGLYQRRGVGWGGRWEGGSNGRGYVYTYGWFLLRFDRKQQNSVKQSSFNKMNKFFKKEGKENTQLSPRGWTILHSQQPCIRVPCVPLPCQHLTLSFNRFSLYSWCVMLSHDEDQWWSFHVLIICHLYVCWSISSKSFAHVLLGCLSYYWLVRILSIFWIHILG